MQTLCKSHTPVFAEQTVHGGTQLLYRPNSRVSYRIFCWGGGGGGGGGHIATNASPTCPIPSARHIIHRVVTN